MGSPFSRLFELIFHSLVGERCYPRNDLRMQIGFTYVSLFQYIRSALINILNEIYNAGKTALCFNEWSKLYFIINITIIIVSVYAEEFQSLLNSNSEG